MKENNTGEVNSSKNSNSSEYILCAAIWFDDGNKYPHQPLNIESGLVFCGHRHACIFPQIGGTVAQRRELGIAEREQGFLTNKNRFVGREEAYEIAVNAGQVKKNDVIDSIPGFEAIMSIRLFSEDLY